VTVPVTVHAGAPVATAAAKEPTGPTEALTPATTKGGPTGGWGRVMAMAPVVATAPMVHSRQATVAA
jgi:hypothetical protein